jgi:hypothetical protein
MELLKFHKFSKTYSIEEPSTEDSQTVKSPPQTAFVTSVTRQGTGDASISAAILKQQGKQTTSV